MGKTKKTVFYLFLSVLYLVIFIAIFGYTNFDIHYTDWCLIEHNHTNSMDININYLDFIAFLNDTSILPYYKDMIYPFQGSVLYIDYAPLIASLVKIFYRFILHSKEIIEIQYAWWFGGMAFILQGIISYKIIKKITQTTNLIAVLCSLFFVTAPILIARFPYHFTLCAQFFIFLSFCPFVFKYTKKQLILLCFTLGFLICGIFIYFFPFVLINLIAYVFYKYFKKEDFLFSCTLLPVFIIGVLIPFIFLGGFSTDLLSYGKGYGYFSANFNTFINPINEYGLFKSVLFPPLNDLTLFSHNQNEGFAYLGGGIIILLMYSFILLFKNYEVNEIKSFIKKYKIEVAVFSSVFIITLLIALTNIITISNFDILHINLPKIIEKGLGVFRTAGRYIWEDFYLIYFGLFIFLIKNINPKKLVVVLFIGFLLQLFDINSAFKILHSEYSVKVKYENPLNNNNVWNKLKEDKKQIVIYSFYPYAYVDFASWAIQNKIKMNNLQLSRDIHHEKYDSYLNKVYNDVKDDILYVFSIDDKKYIQQKTKLENCYFINSERIVCTKKSYKEFDKIKF